MREIAIEILREALSYDPESGRLTWKFRPRGHFLTERVWKNVNNRFAGKEAGTVGRLGYRVVEIEGVVLKAHRIVLALQNGVWPSGEVDHINQDRGDNRFANLREVSRPQNMQNRTQFKINKSGATGVIWHKQNSKWVAHIRINGKRKYLGSFEDFSAAVAARKAAEANLGFHENHGRAA